MHLTPLVACLSAMCLQGERGLSLAELARWTMDVDVFMLVMILETFMAVLPVRCTRDDPVIED